MDADDRPERPAISACGFGEGLGVAGDHDRPWPPGGQDIVDDQGDLGISLCVSELSGVGEVPSADVDGVEGLVVGPAERDHVGPAVRVDGGEPPEATLGQIGQLGLREHAHPSPPSWIRARASLACRYSRAPRAARSTRSARSGSISARALR